MQDAWTLEWPLDTRTLYLSVRSTVSVSRGSRELIHVHASRQSLSRSGLSTVRDLMVPSRKKDLLPCCTLLTRTVWSMEYKMDHVLSVCSTQVTWNQAWWLNIQNTVGCIKLHPRVQYHSSRCEGCSFVCFMFVNVCRWWQIWEGTDCTLYPTRVKHKFERSIFVSGVRNVTSFRVDSF